MKLNMGFILKFICDFRYALQIDPNLKLQYNNKVGLKNRPTYHIR